MTSCSLKAEGCSAAFSDLEISMGASSPWSINTDTQETEGYDHTVCVECIVSAGGGQTIQLDNWNIK